MCDIWSGTLPIRLVSDSPEICQYDHFVLMVWLNKKIITSPIYVRTMQLKIIKINSLTSLRFFACAMIIVLHAESSFGIPRIADKVALGPAYHSFSCCPASFSHMSIPHSNLALTGYGFFAPA